MRGLRPLPLLLWVAAGFALGAEVRVIQQTGPSDQRIDLVVLGDGYTAAEQAKLSDDARSAVEGMFAHPPYSNYRSLFNVKLIHVISNQSGADNGSGGRGDLRDTALGAYYWCGDIERLLCVNEQAVFRAAVADVPEFDVAIVIVNDPKYGGSGGQIAVLSTHRSAVDLLVHEIGHTIGNLADEYQDAYPAYPACPATTDCPEANATLRNTRATAKWAVWIDPSTPVPTPTRSGHGGIGLFEGARYKSSGVYRPADQACMMQFLGQPLCSVCREGLIASFWRRAPLISGITPSNTGPVQLCAGGALSVATPPLPGGAFSFLWTVDGTPVRETSNTFRVDSSVVTGTHTVRVTARDTSPMVRNDPRGVTSQQAQWTVSACTPGPCDVAASCNGATCARTPRPSGTACGVATCTGGQAVGAAACDGAGGCVVGPPVPCAAYSCDDAGAACRTACSTDAHCASGHVCEASACVLPRAPEQPEGPRPLGGCQGCSTGGGVLLWAAILVLGLRRRR